MTSARPFDSASKVEKRWNTRIGSSDESTVTAEPSLMRFVRAAIAASTISGDDTIFIATANASAQDALVARLQAIFRV